MLRRPAKSVIIVAGILAVIIGGSLIRDYTAAHVRIRSSARIAESGVDQHGYWFVRVEIVNTGTLPWREVWVSNPGLVANSPPSLKVSSTLPNNPIPDRFEFVIETVDEGVIPPPAAAVTFDIAFLPDTPWYLDPLPPVRWHHEIPL